MSECFVNNYAKELLFHKTCPQLTPESVPKYQNCPHLTPESVRKITKLYALVTGKMQTNKTVCNYPLNRWTNYKTFQS